MALFAKRHFEKNGKDNRWAVFDCGSAWMSLNLQALELGIYCHGMAGYDPEKAYKVCNVDPEKFYSVCMIALGRIGPPENLPEPLKSRETPSDRKEWKNFFFEGILS
jgi:nitroreductase